MSSTGTVRARASIQGTRHAGDDASPEPDSTLEAVAVRLDAMPMLEAEPWSPRLAGKRLSDVVFSGLLLLVLLPALLLIALAIKLDSRGPVFYRVRRVGYRGRTFAMLKFRKLHHGAAGGPLTAAGDPRLTRVGRILTRTRLDELPQLWDVLRGRMSLVGPRPEDPGFVLLH